MGPLGGHHLSPACSQLSVRWLASIWRCPRNPAPLPVSEEFLTAVSPTLKGTGALPWGSRVHAPSVPDHPSQVVSGKCILSACSSVLRPRVGCRAAWLRDLDCPAWLLVPRAPGRVAANKVSLQVLAQATLCAAACVQSKADLLTGTPGPVPPDHLCPCHAVPRALPRRASQPPSLLPVPSHCAGPIGSSSCPPTGSWRPPCCLPFPRQYPAQHHLTPHPVSASRD